MLRSLLPPSLVIRALGVVAVSLALAGCRQDMHNQPRAKNLKATNFFEDGKTARPTVPGTVAQGQLNDDELLYTGWMEGKIAEVFPFPVTREVIRRGQERFTIYCAPCHGDMGDGNGLIAQRGLRNPPSYHIDRLRNAPVGHFFDVITNGFGSMYDYAARVAPRDRWAIIAYIRALQLSQNARADDVPAQDRGKLPEGK